ncbi:MAG: hypothetical protein ACR2HN_07265 [Tepidiformaceae bacterium]
MVRTRWRDGAQRVTVATVAALTLAHDPSVVGEAAAAVFLARVRDLREAPYALLAA